MSMKKENLEQVEVKFQVWWCKQMERQKRDQNRIEQGQMICIERIICVRIKEGGKVEKTKKDEARERERSGKGVG